MLHFPRWKTLSILATLLVSLILIAAELSCPRNSRTCSRATGCGPSPLDSTSRADPTCCSRSTSKDLRDKLSQQLVGRHPQHAARGQDRLQRHQPQRQRRERPDYQARGSGAGPHPSCASCSSRSRRACWAAACRPISSTLPRTTSSSRFTFSQAGLDAKIALGHQPVAEDRREAASTRWVRPNPPSSSRARIASSCSCRACRTRSR